LAAGVYVAKDHRRALVGAALGVAAGMVVLALGLLVFRSIYLNGVPADVLPQDAAAVLYDTIVRFLRVGLRAVLVLGLVVAAGAFLTGPSDTAVRTRQGLAHAVGWLQGSAEGAGLRTGPVGGWVYDHRRVLRIGAVVLASLALVFWASPPARSSSAWPGTAGCSGHRPVPRTATPAHRRGLHPPDLTGDRSPRRHRVEET
jgi:hypothetical protein